MSTTDPTPARSAGGRSGSWWLLVLVSSMPAALHLLLGGGEFSSVPSGPADGARPAAGLPASVRQSGEDPIAHRCRRAADFGPAVARTLGADFGARPSRGPELWHGPCPPSAAIALETPPARSRVAAGMACLPNVPRGIDAFQWDGTLGAGRRAPPPAGAAHREHGAARACSSS